MWPRLLSIHSWFGYLNINNILYCSVIVAGSGKITINLGVFKTVFLCFSVYNKKPNKKHLFQQDTYKLHLEISKSTNDLNTSNKCSEIIVKRSFHKVVLTNPLTMTLVRESSASLGCRWNSTDLLSLRYCPPMLLMSCFGISCIRSLLGQVSTFSSGSMSFVLADTWNIYNKYKTLQKYT